MVVATELVVHALHLARETHACTAPPATDVPVTTFSSWRLFSEELPMADIQASWWSWAPGIWTF